MRLSKKKRIKSSGLVDENKRLISVALFHSGFRMVFKISQTDESLVLPKHKTLSSLEILEFFKHVFFIFEMIDLDLQIFQLLSNFFYVFK